MEANGELQRTVKQSMKARGIQGVIDFSEFETTPSTSTAEPTPLASGEAEWEKAFNKYINGQDELMEGQTIVDWWGVSVSGNIYCLYTHFYTGQSNPLPCVGFACC